MHVSISWYLRLHGKNDFAEISKNLGRYKLKIILLGHLNNYVAISSSAKSFNILVISLKVIFWRFNKIFFNLYLAKFLNSSAKLFFPCNNYKFNVCILIKAFHFKIHTFVRFIQTSRISNGSFIRLYSFIQLYFSHVILSL